MMKILNVFAVLALLGSATAAYSVKYETILMAEKLKKREAERGREQHAVAILKAEWHLLNRPQRLTKIAPPEQGMQMMTARQIVRAIDIPHSMGDVDMIAKALDGTLTGSLAGSPAGSRAGSVPTPDASRKSTGRTPENPINKVVSSTIVKNQPKKETTVQAARSSPAALPMSLTSNALGSKTTNTPQTRPMPRPIGAPARSAEMLLPPKSVPLAPKASAQIPMR